MYMTRQLSFAGVTFDIKELPLAKDFIEMYDASVKLVSYVLHSNLSVIFCIQITQATVHCLCYLNFFGNFCILIFVKIPSITKITCFIDYKYCGFHSGGKQERSLKKLQISWKLTVE